MTYSERIRIIKCRPEQNFHVWIQFADGLEGIVDLRDLLEKPAFQRAWQTTEQFSRVRIDPITETITWGEEDDEVDINPMELRKEILERGP
jgi:hypothetical protein